MTWNPGSVFDGTVKSFDPQRGYGFLELTSGTEQWFHAGDYSPVAAGFGAAVFTGFGTHSSPFQEPRPGDAVVFDISSGRQGRTEACPWTYAREWEVAAKQTTQNAADPLYAALAAVGLDIDDFHVVDEIDMEVYEGGQSCRHVQNPESNWFLTDGTVLHVEDETYFTPTNSSGNKSHVGCHDKPAVKQVSGGTYLIVGNNARIRQVYVTPTADRQLVADWVTTRNRFDQVVALEVKLGLRCSVCEGSGHLAAAHAAEQAARAAADQADRVAIATAPEIIIAGQTYRRVAFDRQSCPGQMALVNADDQSAFITVEYGGRSVLPPPYLQNPPVMLAEHRVCVVVDTATNDRWYYHRSWGSWRRFPNDKLARRASVFEP